MAIIKIEKRDDPYARIDNRVLGDKRLSYRARGLIAYLLSKPNNWKVRSEELIASGKEGRDAIRTAFKELATLGYARLVATQDGREWHIFETPCDGLQRLETRLCAPPENANVGKPVSIVTKEKSTNEIDLIYQAFPYKVGKPAAIRAIKKALKTDSFEKLLGLTVQFAKSRNGDLEFCPHPATWFNQQRYNDDPSTWIRKNGAHHKTPSRNTGTANEAVADQYSHRKPLRSVRFAERPAVDGDEAGGDAVHG